MTSKFSFVLFGLLALIFTQPIAAQTIRFHLEGMAGPGITAANEPADVVDGGSGDIGPGGIILDLSTGILSVDVEWGSGNGYIDLSSDIDIMNIHGPTGQYAANNFSQSADVFVGLDGFDASATNGGYIGDTDFSGSLTGLLEGRYYLHLHTLVNGGGEARGYMIPNVRIGDINGDEQINLLDVSPFVDLVASGKFLPEADINQDGTVNLLDIGLFVTILTN